ncbi:hypothetical protein DL96DRAFT_1669677 [Flagelloscypha sp. PMI_526]|nr:hypothetical protein DL96DRAFT_1669677 [Flagelloscypha sp. PMI_526]
MVRFKNRWILIEFVDPAMFSSSSPLPQSVESSNGLHTLDERKIWAAVKNSVILNFGDTGWGAVGQSLTVKYYSPQTHTCILRVGRDHHKIAWGAVTLLTSVEGVKVLPNVVHVSGTIKHTQLAAIEHNRKVIARFREKAKMAATYKDGYDAVLAQTTIDIQALQD